MPEEQSKPTPEEWEKAIASYQESYRQLVRLSVHLIESGRDLAALKEMVDGLTESQAKAILTVAAASGANDYFEMSRGAKLN